MFGSNDKDQANNSQQPSDSLPLAVPANDNTTAVSAQPDQVITPTAPPLNDDSALTSDEPVLPPPSPVPEIIADPSKSITQDTPPSTAPAEPAVHNEDELMNIKQQALQSLAPMVHQLDQTPEEKFKTTMMLIQASDNPNLIKDAHEAANAITDEKTRAQALLDVVNEINYFTQHHTEQA